MMCNRFVKMSPKSWEMHWADGLLSLLLSAVLIPGQRISHFVGLITGLNRCS